MNNIVIRGARQHNLKDVSCELPRDRLVVITGPSGSGKSSLAFDTLYAEGQRRYVESLSVYARQFLDQLPKPDVDSIEGLSPAIAIEQRPLGRNPRSTVGTVTEIADYLRLLFARIGIAHCPISGRVLQAYSVQEIVDHVLQHADGGRVQVLGPVARQRQADLADELQSLRRQGFVRVLIDGQQHDLADAIQLDPAQPHDLTVVVDRLSVRADQRTRLTDSVELALKLGQGTVLLDFVDGTPPVVMSDRLVSWEHNLVLPALEPRLFSFNSAEGACPTCGGLGTTQNVDPSYVVSDATRSLREGALSALGRRGSGALALALAELHQVLKVNIDTPWQALPESVRAEVLFGTQGKSKRSFDGLIPRLQRLWDEGAPAEQDARELDDGALSASDVGAYLRREVCKSCNGTRLRKEALCVTVADRNIAELCALELGDLLGVLRALLAAPSYGPQQAQVATPLLRAVVERLGFLEHVGLSNLSLDRPTASLSGGEAQRIRLATQIGAALVGVLYVLDEPSVGLHPSDNEQLLQALRQLVNKGNSVVMVEHDREAILAADHVIDMGPGAGVLGGRIVAQGTATQLQASATSVTGPYLSGKKHFAPRTPRARSTQVLHIKGARANNLQHINVELPLGVLCAITGVSGSGKSSLVMDTVLPSVRAHVYGTRTEVGACDAILGLDQIDKVICIDQTAIGRTPKSTPATASGVMDLLRELYSGLPEARARGYKPGRFSFNVKGGRCEKCLGDGLLRVEMQFLPDMFVRCDACQGKRYNRETLELQYRGLSIADALALSVDEASSLFENVPKIAQRLTGLRRAGLGYIQLGQAATTLSGGEAQRLKLARELWKRATGKTLYVLDEPTTGLHFSDIEHLNQALQELVDAGNSVLLIEHNMDLVACADWVVDLGPAGGRGGGRVVAQGTPQQVSQAPHSRTAAHLANALACTRGAQA